MQIIHKITEAQKFLAQGKIIAYPTEAVYGLGCDPFNQSAVKNLLKLKAREQSKGLIVIISSWQQLAKLTKPISESAMAKVKLSWPGPVTWIFPKSSIAPDWICGNRGTIAIRMSAHPIAQSLSIAAPLVSTSANISGHAPAKDIASLKLQFAHGIDACLTGDLGGATNPSQIYDVVSGERLR
jgi:L-threonylcarbamoyladenylate synthase